MKAGFAIKGFQLNKNKTHNKDPLNHPPNDACHVSYQNACMPQIPNKGKNQNKFPNTLKKKSLFQLKLRDESGNPDRKAGMYRFWR